MPLGESIPEGAEVGVQNKMPQLRRTLANAMANLTNVPLPSLGDVAFAGAGGGRQTSYQITVPLTVYGGEPETVRTAAQDGVLRALRAAGMR